MNSHLQALLASYLPLKRGDYTNYMPTHIFLYWVFEDITIGSEQMRYEEKQTLSKHWQVKKTWWLSKNTETDTVCNRM